jgi:hypothetical protein
MWKTDMSQKKPATDIETSRQDEDEFEYEATIEEYLGDYDDRVTHASKHAPRAPGARGTPTYPTNPHASVWKRWLPRQSVFRRELP